jgi:hypothetical protein
VSDRGSFLRPFASARGAQRTAVTSRMRDFSVTHVTGMDPGILEAPPGFEPGMEVLQT